MCIFKFLIDSVLRRNKGNTPWLIFLLRYSKFFILKHFDRDKFFYAESREEKKLLTWWLFLGPSPPRCRDVNCCCSPTIPSHIWFTVLRSRYKTNRKILLLVVNKFPYSQKSKNYFACNCLSRIRLFSIPDPGSGSASKNLSIFNPNLFLSSRKFDPGHSSPIRNLIFYPSRIPDLGVKKAPDPASATLLSRHS